MTIKFIDIDSMRTFDASSPYVFQMGDNGCSTGKWYSKTLVFASDQRTLSVSFPAGSSFHVIDSRNLPNKQKIDVNGHSYYDLSDIMSDPSNGYESYGTRSENELGTATYIHSVTIVFMSDSEGEFHDTLTIEKILHLQDDGVEKFEIAADVYMEDERLSTDVANEGLEMPDAFQRAIYTTNVRDESSDKLLLNRKWKEILIEYWNVVANKGSYKSLINSLKFFEYGDLLRIEEYWKQKDSFSIEELIGRDIEQVLDPMVRDYLDVLTKTTYIGIYLAMDNLKKKDTGEIEYQGKISDVVLNTVISEPNPELYAAALQWSVDDIRLKMTLLANYFSTFFMPIHLDLIHSCVDRSVFTNTVKILRSARISREDWHDSLSPISCNLTTDNEYWMGNTTAFNYPVTNLRNAGDPVFWGDMEFFGVDPEIENTISLDYDGLENIKRYLNQYFGGVGCIVPVDVCFLGKLKQFTKCTKISIYRKIEGNNYELEKDYVSYEPVQENEWHFNLLFTRAGQYCILLQFENPDGTEFSGSWKIDVHGSIGNLISIKRLKKIDYRDDLRKDFDDWFYDNLDFNSFMFTEGYDEQVHYKQWLPATDGSLPLGIGMNHMVAIDCGPSGVERVIKIECQGELKSFEFTEDIAEILKAFYPHYWWKKISRNVAKRTKGSMEVTDESRYYIIGVRKFFDAEYPDYIDLMSEYYRSGQGTDDEEIEAVNVRYMPSKQINRRGYVVVTLPVGSEISLDNSAPFKTVSNTTTVPVVKERSTLHMRYAVYGHLFAADVEIPDMFTAYGTEDYKVHPEKKKGYATIDESRFFPIFHKLEDIDGFTVGREDTVVCIPQFQWVDDHPDRCWWEFTNRSTGEKISSNSFEKDGPLYIEQPFVGKYDYSGSLGRGYYDVELHFSMGGTEQVETVDSAFRIA